LVVFVFEIEFSSLMFEEKTKNKQTLLYSGLFIGGHCKNKQSVGASSVFITSVVWLTRECFYFNTAPTS
jgi:hypothetical protein